MFVNIRRPTAGTAKPNSILQLISPVIYPTIAATIKPGSKPSDPIKAKTLLFCASLLKGSEKVVTVHMS